MAPGLKVFLDSDALAAALFGLIMCLKLQQHH